MTEDRGRMTVHRLVIEADDDYGFSTWQQGRGINAFFDGLVHPGHLTCIAGIHPDDKSIKTTGRQRRCVSYTNQVKTEVEGFPIYLLSKLHNFYQ